MLEKLFFTHSNVVKDVPLRFKRYLYKDIDWSAHHICLTGARGVGKTTLLLQHYHEAYGDVEKCLYLSADHVDVAAMGLSQIVSDYFSMGGNAVIVDEIHKYPSWKIELKNIVDTFRTKKVLVSGSSSLDLKEGKADLSRRLAYYDLKGLSFREYLHLKEDRHFPALTFENILHHHMKQAQAICSFPVLKSFRNYLQTGYYPFFLEGESTYLQKVNNVIEKVLYEDVAASRKIKSTSVGTLKKILWLVGTSSPFTINIERMSRDLKISKEFVYRYLDYLEEAGLITGLKPDARGFKLIRKPTKLFLENTNLLSAINGGLQTETDQGMARETFFVNQLKAMKKISLMERGDFLVGGRYAFEIGGRNKGFSQLQSPKDSYVAADQIEIGAGRKIPLYLFGFLY